MDKNFSGDKNFCSVFYVIVFSFSLFFCQSYLFSEKSEFNNPMEYAVYEEENLISQPGTLSGGSGDDSLVIELFGKLISTLSSINNGAKKVVKEDLRPFLSDHKVEISAVIAVIFVFVSVLYSGPFWLSRAKSAPELLRSIFIPLKFLPGGAKSGLSKGFGYVKSTPAALKAMYGAIFRAFFAITACFPKISFSQFFGIFSKLLRREAGETTTGETEIFEVGGDDVATEALG